MGDKIELRYKVRAIGIQSVRGVSRGKYYQPSRVVKYKASIGYMTRVQLPKGFKAYEGAIKVEIEYRYKRKGVKSDEYRVQRPDIDSNTNKGVIDALTGIVWIDDSIICDLHVIKYNSDRDEILIKVEVI